MGNLPQIDGPASIAIRLPTPAYLMDHHFQGRPVLPAVEAMEALARTAKHFNPEIAVHNISRIRFDKFLYTDPGRDHLTALAELQPSSNGQWQFSLITRSKAPGAGITRTKVHARLYFGGSDTLKDPWPLDVSAAPEGICLPITPEKLYEQLVPFGPAFRNIVSPVYISPDGALARIKTPDISAADDHCLGSPFALDAAMHAACAWAQHYKGIVAFPVSIDARTIVKPALPDSIYYGRIRPQSSFDDLQVFDIQLIDEHGEPCEIVQGVHMRDVSGGRLHPPEWIICKAEIDPLAALRKDCLGLSVIELDAMASFAPRVLTPLEEERFIKMGPRRRKSFLAARLALKRLYRRCRSDDSSTPAHCIQTVKKGASLPICGQNDSTGQGNMHCSASHDRRLAVAAADAKPVGIDVESGAHRALESCRIYMERQERKLVEASDSAGPQAALRIWSIKEAAAKALGINLADAWQQVQVTGVGDRHSSFMVDGKAMTARHAWVDEHLITVFVVP